MNLNSKYSELELCQYMIKNMSEARLKELVLGNPSLRIKYGAFDKKNFKYDHEKAVNIALTLYKKNKALREAVMGIWEIKAMISYNEDSSIETIEDAKECAKDFSDEHNMFLLAVTLWKKSSSELNEYGDEIFSNCLDNKYESKEEKKVSKVNDNSKILSMNLAECIDAISTYDAKIKEYEEQLKAKDELIKELREQLNGESKDLKKRITKLGKSVEKSSDDIKNSSDSTIKAVDTLKIDLTDIKKEVNKQSIALGSNNKELLNEVTKVIKELQNVVKSSIVEENKKIVKEINESISMKLDTIIENSTKKDDPAIGGEAEEKNEFEEYLNNTKDNNPGVQEFSPELDDLLGGIL